MAKNRNNSSNSSNSKGGSSSDTTSRKGSSSSNRSRSSSSKENSSNNNDVDTRNTKGSGRSSNYSSTTKGNSSHNDNDNYNDSNSKSNYNDEPINDPPPYNDYNNEYSKGENDDVDMTFTEEEVYGNSNNDTNSKGGNNDVDMNFTEEEVYGSSNNVTNSKGGNNDADMNFTEEEVYGNGDNDDNNYSKDGNNSEADMTFTEEEVYGNNNGDEADMVFTEEEVYGDTNNTVDEQTSRDTSRPRTGNLFSDFIDRFGSIRFRNSQDINQFFANNTNQSNFLTWFKARVGGRQNWTARRFGRIEANNLDNFNLVWDRIPQLYKGTEEAYSINIFQFFALVSIMINEVGQRFTPLREGGSLSYMFNTVIPANSRRPEGRKRSYNASDNNLTAFQLFNDTHFLATHRGMANYDLVANTTNRAWQGHEYPRGVETNPERAGIIAEADFYKFSGRGLVQTTWSRNYMRLIEKTMNYSGQNPIITEYKNAWRSARDQGKNVRVIASQTKNRDWDRLFMETNNEFASIAVFKFQEQRNHFLETIQVNQNLLNGTSTGSLYYVGYRVGGSERYGNKVKSRIMQLMTTLLDDASSI